MKTKCKIIHSSLLGASLLALPALVQAQSYTNSSGIIYTVNSGTITITGYTGPGGDVIIPDRIPDIITGLPVTTIGDSAFYESTNVSSVTIGTNVTSIGNNAFQYSSLTSVTIPASVTGIGEGAFYSCRGLTSVTIPSSVNSIESEAFGQCTSLTTITVDEQNSFYTSRAGALFNKSQTTLVEFPAGVVGTYTIPTNVTSIGQAAFYSGSVASVTIPNSVTNIGLYAFVGGPLTTITVDEQNSFYSSLNGVLFNKSQTTLVEFPGGGVSSYTIPDRVTSIGEAAFFAQYGLTNITIPASVARIGNEAFWNCIGLTSVTIPASVTTIESEAFAYCFSLTSVYFQGNAPTVGSSVFSGDAATICYVSGTTGWSDPFAGLPASPCSGAIQTGSLQVTITPAGAIAAGAHWQVDGGPAENSGTTVTNLSPGSHTVSFTPVSGWTRPSNQIVTITNGATTTATGLYSQGVQAPFPTGWPTRDKDVYGSRNGGYATISVNVSTYTNAWTVAGASLPLTGDVLGNSKTELVANVPGGIGIFDGSGASLNFITTGAQLACLADVNGDGALEILAVQMDANYNFQILVYQANGTLLKTIQVAGTGQSDQTVTPIFAADLEGDGQVEIVSQLTSGYGVADGGLRGLEVSSYATGQRVWRSVIGPAPNGVRWANPGDGNLVAAGWGPANDNAGADGTVDYANYTWSYLPATGQTSWIRNYTSGGFFDSGIYLPDLNGDGNREFVATLTEHNWSLGDYGYSGINVLNPADGTDLTALNLGHYLDVWNAAFGDLDGVTGDELVVATYEGTTPFLRAYGSNLAPKGSYSRYSGQFIPLAVADLAGTGVQQVVAVYRPPSGDDHLIILDGGLSQVLWEQDLGAQTIQSAVVDDLNQDGTLELIVAVAPASGPGQVVVLKPSPSSSSRAILTVRTNGVGSLSTNYNGALLQVGKSYVITARAGTDFVFTNWTGGTKLPLSLLTNGLTVQFVMEPNLVLQANFVDAKRPVVAITNVPAGLSVSNAAFTVKGTASDNWQVTNVFYSVNNGGWRNAVTVNNWSNWTAAVMLIPGTNTIAAYAVDPGGNQSPIATSSVKYLVSNRLTLVISPPGGGTVSGVTNGQGLDISLAYTATAKSNGTAGFVFKNWTQTTNGTDWVTSSVPLLYFTMQTNLALQANFGDVRPPTLTITAPTPNQRWSNLVFTVKGTAKDNVQVSNVWCLTNGAWGLAATTTGWSNWTVELALVPGTNIVAAYAEDGAGNRSVTSRVSFVYVPCDWLTVLTSGRGSVSPNYSNVWLAIGRNLSMTATAGSGYVFSNWTGGVWPSVAVLTNNRTLNFMMLSNLVLQAHFVPNPFVPVAGTYQGLFYDTNNGVKQLSSGLFNATVSSNGVFTAKLQQGLNSYPLSGQFSLTGAWFTNSIKGVSNLNVWLQLDLSGEDVLTGVLSNAVWTAQLTAERAVYSKANPAPQMGNYTLVLPGSINAAEEPGGNGFGSVNVDANGNVTFGGTLGDGTKVTQSSIVSKEGQWPLYIALYSGKGSLLGWLTFTNEVDRDIEGLLSWIKPGGTTSSLYPAGFTNDLEAVGSVYASTNGLRVLNLTNGVLILDNWNLAHSLTNSFVLGTNNALSGTNLSRLTITNTTGLFSGSLTNPTTGKAISISGAVLQKLNAGYGYFLGTNQSGSVSLQKNE